MTSGGLGLAESLGQDINQEELDFNDLFMYNPPGEDFGCDKGKLCLCAVDIRLLSKIDIVLTLHSEYVTVINWLCE